MRQPCEKLALVFVRCANIKSTKSAGRVNQETILKAKSYLTIFPCKIFCNNWQIQLVAVPKQGFQTSNQPCPLQASKEDYRRPTQTKLLYLLVYNIELLIPAWILILGVTWGIRYSNNSSLKVLLLVDEHVWTYWLVNFLFKCQDLENINKFTTNSTEKNYYTNTHAPLCS